MLSTNTIFIALAVLLLIGVSYTMRNSTSSAGIAHQPFFTKEREVPLERGVWVWDSVSQMDAIEMERIVRAVKEHGFTAVYLTIDHYLDIYDSQKSTEEYTKTIETFIALAHASGLSVDAVAGARDWAEPTVQYRGRDILDYVAQFNRTHEMKFRALQYDIEPYLLPRYEKNKASVLKNYITFIDELATTASESGIKLSIVVPHFYDSTQGWTPSIEYGGTQAHAFDHVLSILNRREGNIIIVMAYRDHAKGEDGTIELSRAEVHAASRLRGSTTVIVAQETGDVDPGYVTFFNTSKQKLFSELALVEEVFAKEYAYGGYAVHYLEPFLALPKE